MRDCETWGQRGLGLGGLGCLILVSSLKIFIQLKLYIVILPQSKTLFPLSIPPTTGYHSVRIFMLSK